MNKYELQALWADLKFAAIIVVYFILFVLAMCLTACSTVDYTDTGVGCIDDCLEPQQVQMDNTSKELFQ